MSNRKGGLHIVVTTEPEFDQNSPVYILLIISKHA